MAGINKLLQVISTGFVLGFLLALLGLQWFWLEMRFNVGLFIPLAMVISLIGYGVKPVRKYFNRITSGKVYVVTCLIIVALLVFKYGLSGSQVIPAAILRELLAIPGYGLVHYNRIILVMFCLGLLSYYFEFCVKGFVSLMSLIKTGGGKQHEVQGKANPSAHHLTANRFSRLRY